MKPRSPRIPYPYHESCTRSNSRRCPCTGRRTLTGALGYSLRGDAIGRGIVLRNAGSGWALDHVESRQPLFSIWAGGAEVWAVGGGGVLVQRQAGVWRAVQSPASSALYAISGIC